MHYLAPVRYRHLEPIVLLAMLLLLLTGLTACKTEDVISNSYKSLSVAADTYEGSMKTAGDLHARGLLEDETKEQIIDVGRKYRTAHQVATLALETYARTSRAEDKEKLSMAIVEVTHLIWELAVLMEPYISSDP